MSSWFSSPSPFIKNIIFKTISNSHNEMSHRLDLSLLCWKWNKWDPLSDPGACEAPRFPGTISQKSTTGRNETIFSTLLLFSLLFHNLLIPFGSVGVTEARQRPSPCLKRILRVNTRHSQKPSGTWEFGRVSELQTRVPRANSGPSESY